MAIDITRRKYSEQTLRESADVLAGIIESAMDAIIAIDDAQRIVLFNAAAEKMFGCTADEALGNSVERFIPQRFRAGHSTRVRRFDESGVTNRTLHGLGTVWGLRATGEEFPIEASISKAESGGKKFFTVVIRDMTERHRAEEAVRESEQRFRLVADTAPVMIWMSGTDKLCTYFNKSWLDFTGRSVEQERGNGWAEAVHPEDLERCLNTYTESFDRREKFRMEYRLRRHDGEYRWVFDIGVPRFNQDHSFAGYIGSCIDVTERKLAEEALSESEERFRLAAQAGRMYSYEWDVTTDVLVRSPEYAKILGVTEPLRFTRQQFMDKIHPDDRPRFIAAIAGLTPENPTRDVTYRFVRPGGALVWLKNSGRAFFDGDGKMLRVIGMVSDVTDQKQAEEALSNMTRKLVEAQEQERARIARELHDDITQRLAMLAIEIEQTQDHRPEMPSQVRDRAQELSMRAKEISNDIQALSHELHSSKLDYLGIAGGMKSWCIEFGERRGMEIEFKSSGLTKSLAPEISLCLLRVLQEALHNTAKHSGVKRVDVQLWEESNEIQLIVSDSGKGFDVAATMQDRGLGVISMQERVRLVGGTIAIDSKPLGGTTIHVRVPFAAERSSQLNAG